MEAGAVPAVLLIMLHFPSCVLEDMEYNGEMKLSQQPEEKRTKHTACERHQHLPQRLASSEL